MKILEGQVALVTGGSRGIGASIAKALSEAGADVIITGTANPKGKRQQEGIRFEKVDFLIAAECDAFLKKIKSEKIDILINNAGINKINLVEDISAEDWDNIQTVNLKMPFLITKTLVSRMAKRNYGRIVNITSVFGHVSKSQRAAYSASKFGLHGLTKATALDYAKNNVLVNALAPGFIDTELTRSILTKPQIQEIVKTIPMGRLGTPQEIANAVLFLASPLNTMITGQQILVDGGFTCV
jgi:3-oxoacyl-[acyl-carrier protein] reductase